MDLIREKEKAMAPQAAVQFADAATDMQVEVVERRDTPGAWSVEAINITGDGEVYLAVFSGPAANARASEYAAMKYGIEA